MQRPKALIALNEDGTWRMAPAYDLTWSFGPGGEHSSSVLGHGKNITREHLIELGRKADIQKREAIKVVEQAQEAICKWEIEEVPVFAGMTVRPSRIIFAKEQYLPLATCVHVPRLCSYALHNRLTGLPGYSRARSSCSAGGRNNIR